MKILLVDPPGKNKGLNTGLGYLSAMLRTNHEVSILDLNNTKMGLCGDPNPDMPVHELDERIITAVDEFQPDLFGVSVKTFTAEVSKHIFELIKVHKPDITTIAGGPHVTLDGARFIKENRIKFGIRGEGEYALVDLCKALEKTGSPEVIHGLLYWRNGELLCNPKPHTIKHLENLPFPSYDNFSSVISNGGQLREYPLLTSRGCPFQCTYCSMPKIMGGKWRSHTPDKVIEELRHAKQRYRSTSFTVVDDNLTLNLKRIEKICDQLISEKINLPWNSQNGIRADRISRGLAHKMKRSGCRYVWIGIETADEKVFETINKGEKLEDIKTGIEHLMKARIRVGGFFILGLPYSTRETDLKSVNFVRNLGIDGWWFNFVPYPYTQAWDWVQKHGKVLRTSDGVLQFGSTNIEPVFETEDYLQKSRIRTYDEIHIRMKYFDRIADPSLGQCKRWWTVFKKVRPYGLSPILSFISFILKYNIMVLINKVRS